MTLKSQILRKTILLLLIIGKDILDAKVKEKKLIDQSDMSNLEKNS